MGVVEEGVVVGPVDPVGHEEPAEEEHLAAQEEPDPELAGVGLGLHGREVVGQEPLLRGRRGAGRPVAGGVVAHGAPSLRTGTQPASSDTCRRPV